MLVPLAAAVVAAWDNRAMRFNMDLRWSYPSVLSTSLGENMAECKMEVIVGEYNPCRC